jgi:HSP20 family molecular chaperone IbpA
MTSHAITINRGEADSGGAPTRASRWSYRPRIDVTEDAEAISILFDAPGARPDAIRIDCEQDTLHVHGTVPPRQAADMHYIVHEYGIGDFDRTFAVPDSVDPAGIDADYQHGVLTIRLPKAEHARPRRIEVRSRD